MAKQAPPAGAISGVVVDAVSGQPIAGARVTLARTQGGAVARFLTDAKGRFVFKDLADAPNYYLDASKPGHPSTRYGWSGPGGSSAISDILLIPIKGGQWVADLKIPLWRNASISGRIVDERNEPLVGVAVRAYTLHRMAGRLQPAFGPLVVTDDRGMYRMANITPGQYTIAVPSVQSTVPTTLREEPSYQPVGALAPSGVGGGRGAFISGPALDVDGRHRLAITNYATPPPPSADRLRTYPITFYPGVHRPADAQVVTVGYGDNRTSIDIQVVPVAAVRISGRMTGFAGETPNLLLRLMPQGHEGLGFSAEAATTVLERDGSFTFLGVPAGDYTLLAQATVNDFSTASAHVRVNDPPGFPGSRAAVGSNPGLPGIDWLTRQGTNSAFWARQTLSVGSQTIDNLAIPMHPAITIRGKLVFDEGTKPPDRLHLITLTPANGDPSLGEPSGSFVGPPEQFQFEIPNVLGGHYLLSLTWIGRFGVVSVTANGRDVRHSGFDGTIGRDIDDVVVTLTGRRPRLTGTVHGDAGPMRAAVIAFPQDRSRWVNFGWNPDAMASVGSAAAGTFTIDGLPEGDYFVVAVDPKHRNDFVNPDFLAKVAPLATEVSLKWGDSMMRDLRVVEVK